MARALLKHVIKDAAGQVIQNAAVNVYRQGTTTAPYGSMFNAKAGGSTVTNPLVSNAQGEIQVWLDTPQPVDLQVTDNSDLAFYPSTPLQLLTWTTFTESADVLPAVEDIPTMINVKASGAVGDGVVDDKAAIQAAIDAIPASGGTIFFPAGTYLLPGGDPALNIGAKSHLTLQGVGPGSILKLTGSTGTPAILGVSTQDNLTIKDLQLYSTVTAVPVNHLKGTGIGKNWRFERVYFKSDGSASGSQPYITNIDAGSAGGLKHVTFLNCFFENLASVVTMQVTGLLLRGLYDLTISNCTFRNINNPIAPDNMYQKEGLVYTNNIEVVDTSAVHCEGPDIWGWNKITYVGNVQRNLIAYGSDVIAAGGMIIDSGNGVGCTDVVIADNTFVRNAVQVQAKVGAGNVCKNIVIADNVMAGSRTGAGYNGDIVIYDPGGAGQLDNLTVNGNILRGTATNRILFPPVANITDLRVFENIGYNGTLAPANIGVGASPFTYTNNDFVPEDIYVMGGTVSRIDVFVGGNNAQVFNASPATVPLNPGDRVDVYYTVAPTMTKVRK